MITPLPQSLRNIFPVFNGTFFPLSVDFGRICGKPGRARSGRLLPDSQKNYERNGNIALGTLGKGFEKMIGR